MIYAEVYLAAYAYDKVGKIDSMPTFTVYMKSKPHCQKPATHNGFVRAYACEDKFFNINMMATIRVNAVNKQTANDPLEKFALLLGLSEREGKHKPSPVSETILKPKVKTSDTDTKESKGEEGVKKISETSAKVNQQSNNELERALSECVAEALDELSDDDDDADANNLQQTNLFSGHCKDAKTLEPETMIDTVDLATQQTQQPPQVQSSLNNVSGVPSKHLGSEQDRRNHEMPSESASVTTETKHSNSFAFLGDPHSARKKTTNLIEGMDFMKDFVQLARLSGLTSCHTDSDPEDLDLNMLAQALSDRTTSIAFAGIAAHDCVDRLLADYLSKMLGRLVKPPTALWHLDYNSSCQEEIRILHSSAHNSCLYNTVEDEPCIFSDIHTFWRPEVVPIIDSLKSKPWMSVEVLADLLMQCRAVRLSGYCKRHNRNCRLRPSRKHSCGSATSQR